MIKDLIRNSILVLSIIFTFSMVVVIANACDRVTPLSEDLWTSFDEGYDRFALYKEMMEDGWIKTDVTYEEFDYITVLAKQLQSFYPNVRYSVIVSMIAMESRFDQHATNGKAVGLMQLTPHIYKNRGVDFFEEVKEIEADDAYDIRFNLTVGIDYFSYILDEVDKDEAYALMWYNQGPISASDSYVNKGRVSTYAKTIIELADKLDDYLRRENQNECSN